MANGTIPGAIRWDAWYGGGNGSEGTVNAQVCASLGPTVFQSRAPWFAQPVSPFLNSINGNTQATMDAEITYAANAGLKYWAFVWYGQQTPASPMMNAWNLYQSSSLKANINWSMMLQFSRISSSSMAANQATYVTYFQQSNYQTVLTGRPLLYLFIDDPNHLATGFSNSWTNVQTAFNNLRTATTTAGLPTPYIVLMYGTASSAATWATDISADAISNYTGGNSAGVEGGVPWTTFEPTVEAFWATMAATSSKVVPICMCGADQRPRKAHPPTFSGFKPNFGLNGYVVAPTGAQLTSHLQAAVSYVVANPSVCDSKAILIYAWDECDEFGALIPSYNAANPAAPITTAIDAVAAVTW